MRYGLTFFLLTLITFSNIYGQIHGINWFKKAGNTKLDIAHAMTVTRSGDIYVTGEFSLNILFDPEISAVSTANVDMFLTKFTNSGQAIWVKRAGGIQTDRGRDVVADEQFVYLAGEYFDSVQFEDTLISSSGNLDGFIVKYDTAGNLVWLREAKNIGQTTALGVALDSSKNVIAVGYYGGTQAPRLDSVGIFNDKKITSNGLRDIFLVKYDSSGNVIWVNTIGGRYSGEEAGTVTCDAAGNIYVGGKVADSAYFGNVNIRSFGGVDMFLAKYDPAGSIQWVRTAGGTKEDNTKSIAVDAVGNVYITGYFDSSATFGSTNIVGNDGYEIAVAKYNSMGELLWIRHAGGPQSDQGLSISADDRGCFVTGKFSRTAKFDTMELTSNSGSDDIFIAHYDPFGNLIWVKQIGGNDNDKGMSIKTDQGGNLYLCGSFRSTVTLENGNSFTTSGIEDIFLAKLGNAPVPVELASFDYSVTENYVKLAWSSVTETNNAYYDVERSLDNSNFIKIGTVHGNGTTSEKHLYEFVDQNIMSGKYYYRLKQNDFDGSFTYSQVLEVQLNTPSSFALHQNYPNPFNPETRITFELPSESIISIRVFDMTGREAAVLAEHVNYAPGIHSVNFNAGTFSSGIYLYSIQAVTAEGKYFTAARKMSLIK